MASRQAGRQDGVRPGVSGYAAARPRPHRCRRLLLHTGLTAPLQVHLPSAAPTTHTFLGGHDGGRTIRRDGKQAGRYGVRLLSGTSAATDVDGCCCTQGTQLLCRCTCPLCAHNTHIRAVTTAGGHYAARAADALQCRRMNNTF